MWGNPIYEYDLGRGFFFLSSSLCTVFAASPPLYAVPIVASCSGESGAGKTESAKLIIKQIVELCQTGSTGVTLEKKILDVRLFLNLLLFLLSI